MKKRSKVLWGLGGAFFGLMGGTALTLYFFTGFGSYDLPREAWQRKANEEAAKRAGIWEKWPDPPPGAMTESDFWREAKTLPVAQPKSPAQNSKISGATQVRASIHSQIATIHKFSQIKDVGWQGQGDFPNFAELKGAAKLLALDATLAAQVGDLDGALRDLRDIRRLARLCAGPQQTTAFYVAAAIESIGEEAATDAAESWTGPAQELARMSQIYRDEGWTIDPARLVRAEEYAMRQLYLRHPNKEAWVSTDMFNDLADMFEDAPSEEASNYPVFQVPGRMVEDTLFSRHYGSFAKLIAAADQGWEAFVKVSAEIDAKSAAASTMSWATGAAPSFQMLPGVLKKKDARRLILQAGIERLENPALSLPNDPYQPGARLRIASSPDGFVIYSVGKNGADDKGELEKNLDLGFEFKVKR